VRTRATVREPNYLATWKVINIVAIAPEENSTKIQLKSNELLKKIKHKHMKCLANGRKSEGELSIGIFVNDIWHWQWNKFVKKSKEHKKNLRINDKME